MAWPSLRPSGSCSQMCCILSGVGAAPRAVCRGRGNTKAADTKAAPIPDKMQDNLLQLPEGRKLGQAIKVQVDHSDGKSMWVFDRCSANSCADSTVAPIMKFDSTGKFVQAF